MRKNLIIIGGGASGLFCAISAAKLARRENKEIHITVIEKNERVGKKILATGNGKCNLLNRTACADDYFEKSDFAGAALSYTPDDIENDFKEMGILTTADACGRVYPKSESAACVLDALRFTAKKENITIITNSTVTSVRRTESGFCVTADKQYRCDCVVLAVGSPAGVRNYGGSSILNGIGTKVKKMKPCLSPVMLKEKTPSLKGVRVKGTVTLHGETDRTQSGEIQFADGYLSGICVMNLSRFVSDSSSRLTVDAVSEYSTAQLTEFLSKKAAGNPNLESEHLLSGIVNKRLALFILKRLHISPGVFIGKLTDAQISAVANMIKNLEFTVYPCKDFSRAQVARGGIDTAEIDPNTMMIKSLPRMYACGESVDVDGPCGGYNLYWAFATAKKAALSAVKNL